MQRSALRVAITVVMVVLVQAAATAQQRSGSDNPLGLLLQQLQDLDKAGGLDGGNTSGGSALDKARQRAAAGLLPSSPFATEPETLPGADLALTPAERLIVDQFCSGAEGQVNERLISSVLKFSRLERDYCRRVGATTLQIGYEIFDGDVRPETLVNGAIPDDYVLGIGDELVVSFQGTTSSTVTTTVDREGRLFVLDFSPIPAAGRSFGDLRRDIKSRTRTEMIGTQVFVSLGSVRVVSVSVAGEVPRPGIYQLTGLSTVFDAVAVAGGISKTGSLRQVRVERGDRVFWIDIYDLLFRGGVGTDITLFAGDRIVVPTIGATVAIAGQVNRPGIYEFPEGMTSASLSEILAYAGGTLRPSGNVFSKISFDETGREVVNDQASIGGKVQAGDIVFVYPGRNYQTGTVQLSGHVRVPGRRSRATVQTVRGLIGEPGNLKENPYLLFAVLQTTDPGTRTRRLFPVNLQGILDGRLDYALRDDDELVVLSSADVAYLLSDDVQQVLRLGTETPEVDGFGKAPSQRARGVEGEPATVPRDRSAIGDLLSQVAARGASNEGQTVSAGAETSGGRQLPKVESDTRFPERSVFGTTFACRGLQSLATIVATTQSGRFNPAVRAIELGARAHAVNPLACPGIYDDIPLLLPFMLEHVVTVDGEVRVPGAYPVIAGTSLTELAAVAGGLTREANLRNIELTRFSSIEGADAATGGRRVVIDAAEKAQDVLVSPGDVVRFNRVFTDRDSGPVLLSGEFVRPGLYDIRRGERLSEVILRAGGLTAQAFPYGAVFTRERVKRAQQEGFERALRELNAAATFAAAKKGIDPTAVVALQEVTRELGSVEAIGRVVIEADPTVLQVRPELDTVLEPGDRIFVPKRPNSVLVIGDVLNPGALQFIAGQKADTYIRQAGGFQQSADEDRVFVVYPNGVAQPISVSVWNYNPVQVPPGSTIVAPKNPAPLDIFTFSKDIATLVSQLAITAASLAVIGNN